MSLNNIFCWYLFRMLCGKNRDLFISRFWKACLQGSYKLKTLLGEILLYEDRAGRCLMIIWSNPTLYKDNWVPKKGDKRGSSFTEYPLCSKHCASEPSIKMHRVARHSPFLLSFPLWQAHSRCSHAPRVCPSPCLASVWPRPPSSQWK